MRLIYYQDMFVISYFTPETTPKALYLRSNCLRKTVTN